MIKNISIDLLIPFENHPFKKRSGIEQQELTESIKENGLLEPIIVCSFPEGKYEIISGHRRAEACKELGITEVPATIKEMNKDEATTVSAKKTEVFTEIIGVTPANTDWNTMDINVLSKSKFIRKR